MAYTATVEKLSVSKRDNLYVATIRMVVNDGVSEVFEATAEARYNPNAPDMAAVKTELQRELVAKWDKWVAEQNIFAAAAFDQLITQLQEAAQNYVNQ